MNRYHFHFHFLFLFCYQIFLFFFYSPNSWSKYKLRSSNFPINNSLNQNGSKHNFHSLFLPNRHLPTIRNAQLTLFSFGYEKDNLVHNWKHFLVTKYPPSGWQQHRVIHRTQSQPSVPRWLLHHQFTTTWQVNKKTSTQIQ